MDIMIDLETLGTKPGCVVLAIGAMMFEPIVSPIGAFPGSPPPPPFYSNIDLFSSLLLGLTIDPKTLQWWQDQEEAAQNALFNNTAHLAQVIDKFNSWVRKTGEYYSPQKKELIVWAKSPDFDCAIWEHCAGLLRLDVPWEFRDKRDVRTICGLTPLLNGPPSQAGKVGIHHNALDDCTNQIADVQHALKGLSYGPQT